MKYLGVDFGLRRIGLAYSEGLISSSLKTVQVKGLNDSMNKVLEVIKKENIEKVIVGLPEGKIGEATLKFVNALKKLGLDVQTQDETLSSKNALKKMIEIGIGRKDRRYTDEAAAAIILQNYLDTL